MSTEPKWPSAKQVIDDMGGVLSINVSALRAIEMCKAAFWEWEQGQPPSNETLVARLGDLEDDIVNLSARTATAYGLARRARKISKSAARQALQAALQVTSPPPPFDPLEPTWITVTDQPPLGQVTPWVSETAAVQPAEIDVSRVTRVGLIPPEGPYEEWWNRKPRFYLQDDGRTLKVDLTRPAPLYYDGPDC